MNREKALTILSLYQIGCTEESEMYQALDLALDDMALVFNILMVYGDDTIGEDWLCVIDDMIKGFMDMEKEI